MKTSKYLILTFLPLILLSCATKELRPDQYIEVGRGEKALLITTNPETLNLFDWMIDSFFEAIFGESDYDENVSVSEVDGKPVSNSFIYDNQHILIEPGNRTILLTCLVSYKDKNKINVYGINSVQMKFEGGFKYNVKFDSYKYNDCKSKIEPDEKYNKSLNQTGAKNGNLGSV